MEASRSQRWNAAGAIRVNRAAPVSTTASAGIYTGTPDLGFHADRDANDFLAGTAKVDFVRVYNCGGGHTDYAMGTTEDPVLGFSVQINGGDLCSAEVFWNSSVYITGKGFTLKASPSSTVVDLDPLKAGEITPFSVVAGEMDDMADGPVLVPTVN